MSTPRPRLRILSRFHTASVGFLAGALALPACTGVEGDVLSPRPIAADLGIYDAARPVDGSASICTEQTLTTTSCVLLSTWLLKAQAVCSSFGLLTGPVEVEDPCMMMDSRSVRFTCCPPLPPVPVCEQRLQGDGMSCRETKDWLDSATVDCMSHGERMVLPVFDGACAAHRYLLVKYMCCADPGAPPAMLR
jgi:hypothetical protein